MVPPSAWRICISEIALADCCAQYRWNAAVERSCRITASWRSRGCDEACSLLAEGVLVKRCAAFSAVRLPLGVSRKPSLAVPVIQPLSVLHRNHDLLTRTESGHCGKRRMPNFLGANLKHSNT